MHVTSFDNTRLYPAGDGKEDQGHLCFVFSTFFRHHAKVAQVVRGNWDGAEEVAFIHLQHTAYIPDFLDDCYVTLERIGPTYERQMKVKYGASRMLSNHLQGDREAIKGLLGQSEIADTSN